jgi:long-chain acyl-CoA synthetase
MLVLERIADTLRRRPAVPALEFRGRWYDWVEMAQGADSACDVLDSRGARAGMRVALVARNRPGHVAALLGLLARGLRVQMVYAFQPAAQLAEDLRKLDVAGVLLDREDATGEVIEVLRARGVLGIAIDGCLDESAAVISDGSANFPQEVDEGIAIEMLTSGTTGAPKRISIRRDTLDKATADLIRAGAGATTPDILSFPIGNVSGLYYLIPACANATPLTLLEKFNIDEWLAAVARHRPTFCALPPAAIRMLLDAAVPKDALAGMSGVGVGAAPLEPKTQVEFEDRFGVPVLIGYGATEFCGVVAAWTLEDYQQFGRGKLGSVGRARPGVVMRVVDPGTAEPAAVGEIGLIEAQVERIGPDFLRTTDLGSIDADGFLFLHGRADDIINRGGFKVQPQKIEALLRQHPSVAEAAVVARKDDRIGEVPVAVIELREGSQTPAASELEALLRSQVRPPEVPERFVFVDALPRTPSMKVRRAALRDLVNEAN